MSVKTYQKIVGTGSIPVWQGGPADLEVIQGGFALDRTGLSDDVVLQAGTPLIVNEATRQAKPLKTGVFNANATNSATTYQVKKGHNYLVGDNFSATPGSTAYAITNINTSSPDYDVITVGTTLGTAVTAGQLNFGSSAAGASASSLGGVNALLYTDTIVGDGVTVTAVRRGAIYARRVPYSSALAAALPLIFYSQSY